MTKRRDIIIAVVIASAFLFAMVTFTVLISSFSEDGDFAISVGNDVGVIEVYGVLDESTGRPIIRQLDRWAKSSSIEAIVLHVNSPGGGVAISQEIYDAIKRAKEKKPIVAAFASVSASGGYYISCAANKIIANPGTITGSIGVIFQFHTFDQLMGKVGIGTQTVKSGELKDVGSYARPMTEKEELMLKSVVMDSYEQFVEVVSEGREMAKEEVYSLADGSIYTGLQAYHLGLVDTIGGLDDAINLAASMANISGEPNVVREAPRGGGSIFDRIQGLLGKFDQTFDQRLAGPQLMYLFE